MAHTEQAEFCRRIAARWPHLFQHKRVLDCGSLDINGNNRYLFTGGSYTGIDIVAGANVDVVTRIHEYDGGQYDVVISTEAFEHDAYFSETFSHMIEMVAAEGILLFTCATTGRSEHGTEVSEAWASPGTLDHYRNITPDNVIQMLSESFRCWGVEVVHSDIYGWGLDRCLDSVVMSPDWIGETKCEQ